MSPAPSALRVTWAPVIPSSRSLPITGPAIKAAYSTRFSCAKKAFPYRIGSKPRPLHLQKCSSKLGLEMTDLSKTWLTQTEELERDLEAPDLIIVDASWHLPTEATKGRDDY